MIETIFEGRNWKKEELRAYLEEQIEKHGLLWKEANNALNELLELVPDEVTIGIDIIRKIVIDLRKQMVKAIDGPKTGIRMYNTMFRKEKLTKKLKEGEKCLVVDVGGSNLKIGVLVVKNNELIYEKAGENDEVEEGKDRYLEASLPKESWTAEDFFDWQATNIPISWLNGIKSIAYIYSFIGQPEELDGGLGIDITSEDRLAKNIYVEGLKDGGHVTQQLLASILKKCAVDETVSVDNATVIFGAETDSSSINLDSLRRVAMNDTVATVKDSLVGICSTGFNYAIWINGVLYNTEIGYFQSDNLPTHKLLSLYDATTTNPDELLTEKMISGQGVAGQFLQLIARGVALGFFSIELAAEIQRLFDEDRLNILFGYAVNKNWNEATTMLNNVNLNNSEQQLLQGACNFLFAHSIQVHGTMIAGMVASYKEDQIHHDALNTDDKLKVEIPLEGSFFWNVPGYHKKMMDYLKYLQEEGVIDRGVTIKFKGDGERIGMIGAGKKSLTYEQQNPT